MLSLGVESLYELSLLCILEENSNETLHEERSGRYIWIFLIYTLHYTRSLSEKDLFLTLSKLYIVIPGYLAIQMPTDVVDVPSFMFLSVL